MGILWLSGSSIPGWLAGWLDHLGHFYTDTPVDTFSLAAVVSVEFLTDNRDTIDKIFINSTATIEYDNFNMNSTI